MEAESKKYLREWEEVSKAEGLSFHTYRLRVPGGWLVRIEESYPPSQGGAALSAAMCFVADPNGDWQLEEEIISPASQSVPGQE